MMSSLSLCSAASSDQPGVARSTSRGLVVESQSAAQSDCAADTWVSSNHAGPMSLWEAINLEMTVSYVFSNGEKLLAIDHSISSCTGVANGLKPGQAVGDLVIGESVVNHEFDCRDLVPTPTL